MTKSQINKLGKQIRNCIKENKQPPKELIIKLQEYRISFKDDISIVFDKCYKIAKSIRKDSITSFRIKRIESIISKLDREPTMALGNMGDIAGCRILVYHENAIQKIITEIHNNFNVKQTKNYLTYCKDDGYKGYHLYIESPNNHNKLIEIQIRTVKSHTWASMVEILDILYNKKIKEGEEHRDFKRFLYLLSTVDSLSLKEKQEIITIDKTYEIHSKFIEVFIQNNTKFRLDWFNHNNNNNHYFIIEVDDKKMSRIYSFPSYEIAENEYFKKFQNNNKSNFVLTYIEKPNFKRVCIAYASYVLINHEYLNDWYKITQDILKKKIQENKNTEADEYKNYIQETLKKQINTLKKEIKEIQEYKKNDTHNLKGAEEWLEEVIERLSDIIKIVANEENNKTNFKLSIFGWLKAFLFIIKSFTHDDTSLRE